MSASWPDLAYAAWAPTKKTLHLYTQMLGKLRVALSPDQPNWMFTSLALTARGLTTGTMPWQGMAVQGSLDVFASELRLERSDGGIRTVALLPPRTVADVYADLSAALRALDVAVTISPLPQEVPDQTPLDTDRRAAAYDPGAVQRWFTIVTAVAGAFDAWRAHFFGRTGIQLWWGALDVALLLFNGRHVPAPTDRGYLMQYDLDAELLNVGFFPGDDASPVPTFYGYVAPEPAGCGALRMPPGAVWSTEMHEWFLPYDAVRTATDPAATLRAFCDALYDVCANAAGWDRAALSYAHPPRRRAVPS
jgi:hypothetical protein